MSISNHTAKRNSRRRRRQTAGLTLVELLVVIAVVGFFSAMAIPTIKDILSESMDVTAKRNAQNIAMVASVAEVIGPGAFKEVTSLKQAVDLVISGSNPNFKNASFASGDLAEQDKLDAMRFLRFEHGVILYSADPSRGDLATGGASASIMVTSPTEDF